jgi:RNA polymerase sigma factor (sigma-70 family)
LPAKTYFLQATNDDTRLSAQLSKDDVTAFDALYYKYHRAIFANIFKLVQQQQATEDILQDVFASLWINRKKIDREKTVGGWLFVVSYNKAIKFLNKAVREKIGVSDEGITGIAETPEVDIQATEYQYYLINEAIRSLPPKKKKVFILCKLEGMTYEEAALALGISPHTVKEYVSSSLKFVKEYALSRHTLNTPLSLSLLIAFFQHVIIP